VRVLSGRYELLAPLGRGAMGVVYRAHDRELDRVVAVKVLPAEMLRSEVFRTRFRREARAAAGLSHPNISVVYDLGEESDAEEPVPYLVMELVEGGTLADLIRESPPTPQEAGQIVVAVLEALEHSHERGVVHRDIKPSNVMVHRVGGRVRVKVMDFGIAKLLSETATRLTAKQRLEDAISDATALRLQIADDGSLHFPESRPEDALDPVSMVESVNLRQQASGIHDRFEEALRLANTADERLANGLSRLGTDSLEGRNGFAESLARKLADFDEHPVNLPPWLVEYAREAARRHGISDRLMLMTLWQEQQWYQNYRGYGPFSVLVDKAGREANELWQDRVDGTKSMGVTHMKVDTARDLVTRDGLTDPDGRPYSSYSNEELAEKIEHDPQFAIDLTARKLAALQNEDEEQPWSDKQTFFLYAVDDEDPTTREANRQYGDSTEDRKNDIRPRAENWDRVAPVIDAQQDWERLSPEDRQRALDSVGAPDQGSPLHFPYPPSQEGPSPTPGPTPRPSGG
jgi:tRNA A-37 threonylcarbamoyl transferase component Bud32